MRAKVAKTKILELDFRRRITIVCFLFAAQGTRTWTLADIAELLNRLFKIFIVVVTQTSYRRLLAVTFHVCR